MPRASEMHHPRDTPAVDSLFARVMEMKVYGLSPTLMKLPGGVVDRNRELQDRSQSS